MGRKDSGEKRKVFGGVWEGEGGGFLALVCSRKCEFPVEVGMWK